MDAEPLQLLPIENWQQLELSLKLDWPRSILVIKHLETLKRFPNIRRSFDFKIYCPYGDVAIGVLSTCLKKSGYEVIMHCSSKLQLFLEAIKKTKVINFNIATVFFTDRRVMMSVAGAMRTRNVEWWHLESYDTIYFDRDLFDVQIPEDVTFGLLSVKHAKQVDSKWEHPYPGSEWFFEQLIKSHLGYGLFEKDSKKLVAWTLYTEAGMFDYMHVLDAYRKKGYGELLTKMACNSIRKDKEYVYAFCVKGNDVALTMFKKLGFKIIGEAFGTIFKGKTQSKI